MYAIRRFFILTSAFADDFETRFLRPLHLDWDTWGDPASWVHHACWTALAGVVGAGIGGVGYLATYVLGAPNDSLVPLGATIASGAMVLFYVVREGLGIKDQLGQPGALWRGAPHWTGWLVDGIVDVVGPVLVHVAAARWYNGI